MTEQAQLPFNDGLKSLTAGLGTSRDKSYTLTYERPELDDEQILNAYRGSWLPKKIIDIPALDSCRKWRAWQADKVTISAIEREEQRLDVKRKVLDARKKARLFGGSAIYFATGDENVELPLDPSRVARGGVKHLTVMTRRTLMAGDLDIDPMSPGYGEPSYYQIASNAQGLVKIHPSRLIRFYGSETPTEISSGSQHWSWGDSVLLSTLKAIKDADGTAANIASLVFEAKVDVFKIPGLMNKIRDPRYESDLLTRFAIAATGKGNNGALILDKDEEYDQKTISFASLPDVLDRFLQIVSGAADIPVTRLLGQSPAGLSSTGESDIRNYYDRIQSSQELEIQPAMMAFDEALIRSATGTRDPDVHYTWRSLWQTSEKERSDIGKTTADTIKTLSDTGLFPEEVLSKTAVNMLTENGVAPGLEGEMDDYSEGLPSLEEEGTIIE